MALAYAAETVHALRSQVEAAWGDFGLSEAEAGRLHEHAVREAVRAGPEEASLRAIGRDVIASAGVNNIACDMAGEISREAQLLHGG